jgi:hypothetical protein
LLYQFETELVLQRLGKRWSRLHHHAVESASYAVAYLLPGLVVGVAVNQSSQIDGT